LIPDVSKALSWLEAHPEAIKGIQRGIERETLRVTPQGKLATTGHPEILGSALTHKWITTDFAEALLEFITPVDDDLDHLMTFLRDIHRHTARHLDDDQRMWPLSMPCFIQAEQDIELAQYGTSNIGRKKTLYREGLKNRYGALMQTISGLHYNFSLPDQFWQAWGEFNAQQNDKELVSAGYLALIRNYYRFAWMIPYLFGASPAICSSFLQGRETNLPFKRTEKGLCYLPYATSLRLSDLGYTNKSQSNLGITYNHLATYIDGLKRAIITPSAEFAALGVKVDGKYRQLNANVLQIENELYAPIRPKRVTKSGESPSDALQRGGIEYIEVRSLDINPFSAVGIDEVQARFLDLFLIWCVLAESPEMDYQALTGTRENWNRVVIEGRKPGLTLNVDGVEQSLQSIGESLFADLRRIAKLLDQQQGTEKYQQACDQLVTYFANPELTYSARLLQIMLQEGNNVGLELAEHYRQILSEEALEILSPEQLEQEQQASLQRQQALEASDTLDFEAYLQVSGG